MERRYGLDWLRVGAFGLLIFYHIGMFFVPWDWHVKTAHPLEWVQVPMMAVNAWRLDLLFLISGVASRYLLAKLGAPGRFARSRSARLLIPLVAGMAFVVAPQPWAELQEKFGYTAGFWHYWTTDYFRFGKLHGLDMPTWNHLWFVAYLWVYSLVLAAIVALLPLRVRASLQSAFEGLFAGWRLLLLPIAWFALTRVTLFPIFGETHGLFDDLYNHAVYLPLFLFGFALARAEPLWGDIARLWKPALALAVAGYAVVAAVQIAYPGETPAPDDILIPLRIARSIQCWGAIVALLALAHLKLHHDGPARRYLTEAVFPFYIAHQTIIVVTGHWLNRHTFGPTAEFAILITATAAGCLATYEIARRVPPLGVLVGLKWGRR